MEGIMPQAQTATEIRSYSSMTDAELKAACKRIARRFNNPSTAKDEAAAAILAELGTPACLTYCFSRPNARGQTMKMFMGMVFNRRGDVVSF
jgi:hypothetical protein